MTGRKLLLADDSVTIQKVVDLTFTDEGMQVITVGDGEQAIRKLEEFTPDIVLADVLMPGVDGYRLCEFMKQSQRYGRIPVMLLVGSFEPFDEAEARRVGADDFLTKPFQSIRQLVSRVGSLLSGKSEEPEKQEFSTLGLEQAAAQSAPGENSAEVIERWAPPIVQVNESEDADIELQTADTLKFGPEQLESNYSLDSNEDLNTKRMETITETTPSMKNFSDALLDLEDLDTNSAPEIGDSILELDYEIPLPVATPASSERFASASEFSSAPSATVAVASVADREEVTLISTAAPDSSWTIVKDEPAVEDVVESKAPSEGVTSPSHQIALNELSPEAIDAIARRVVEQLSDKVVREIAWDVVPELSELLIKQRLDENK